MMRILKLRIHLKGKRKIFVVAFKDANDDFEGDIQFLKTDDGKTAKYTNVEGAQELMKEDVEFYIKQNENLGEYTKTIEVNKAHVEFKDHGHRCEWFVLEIT